MKKKLLAKQEALITAQDWLIKILLEQLERYKKILSEQQEMA